MKDAVAPSIETSLRDLTAEVEAALGGLQMSPIV